MANPAFRLSSEAFKRLTGRDPWHNERIGVLPKGCATPRRWPVTKIGFWLQGADDGSIGPSGLSFLAEKTRGLGGERAGWARLEIQKVGARSDLDRLDSNDQERVLVVTGHQKSSQS